MFSGPRAAGTWVGMQNAIGNLSGIIGPVITAYVIKQAGWDSALMLTAAIAAIGAIWWAIGVPRIEPVKLD
jgi:sugar phosphate permease